MRRGNDGENGRDGGCNAYCKPARDAGGNAQHRGSPEWLAASKALLRLGLSSHADNAAGTHSVPVVAHGRLAQEPDSRRGVNPVTGLLSPPPQKAGISGVTGACWLHPIFFQSTLMKFNPASARGSLFAPSGIAFKKKCLADHGGNGRRLERFGDEESRLRTFAGEKALGKRRDENDGHFEQFQKLVHGIETGAAVGKLDIGENETG